MSRVLKAALRGALGTALALYPFWAWYGLSHWSPAVVAAGLALLCVVRAAVTRSREDLLILAIALLLAGAAAFSGLEEPMRFYPVMVNASLLWAFGTTLARGRTPMVERFARMKDPVLSPEAVRWCRGVTLVWCSFFILNGGIALATVFLSRDLWLLWNGCLSYVAIGLLFAGEWMTRTIVMRRRADASRGRDH